MDDQTDILMFTAAAFCQTQRKFDVSGEDDYFTSVWEKKKGGGKKNDQKKHNQM